MPQDVTRKHFVLGAGASAAGIFSGLASGLTFGLPAMAKGGPDIPVGVMVPLTGGGAPYGPNMLKAIEITADSINKAGGPIGRQLRIISEDSQTSPDAAVAAAQKLISLNHVGAIIGTWSSAVTLAVLPITTQAGVLEMNTSGAGDVTSPKYRRLVFRTQPTDRPYGLAMARFSKKQGYRKLALMVLNNPYALTMRDAIQGEWRRLGMPAVENVVVYNPKAASYAGEVQKALQGNPDLLIIIGYTPDASIIAKEWYAANVKTHVMGPGFAFNDALVKNVGAAVVNGFFAVDGIPPVTQPGYKAFAETFQAATGASLADNFWPAQAHDQINLLALAMEAAKSTDAAAVAAKMRAIAGPPGVEVYDFATGAKLLREGKKINYQGASGPCDFDDHHDIVSDFAVWRLDGTSRQQLELYPARELT